MAWRSEAATPSRNPGPFPCAFCVIASGGSMPTYDTEMPRVLLVLPSATYRAPDFLDAAGRLGAEVVVGSEHRQALSESMGDRAVPLSLGQPERAADQIEKLHRRAPLDAIVAVDDGGTRAASEAARRLGLRGNPPSAVARARNKAAMREAFSEAGVPQ